MEWQPIYTYFSSDQFVFASDTPCLNPRWAFNTVTQAPFLGGGPVNLLHLSVKYCWLFNYLNVLGFDYLRSH